MLSKSNIHVFSNLEKLPRDFCGVAFEMKRHVIITKTNRYRTSEQQDELSWKGKG